MSQKSVNKILLIDDSSDYRKLLVNFFSKAYPDSEIVEFDPGEKKPPEGFPWSDYDLLILDYDLGKGGNGLEWLRQYKTTDSFPATVMLTAHDEEEIVVKAIRYGAQAFLRKSGLTKSTLVESIENAIDRHSRETKQSTSGNIRVHVYNKENFLQSLSEISENDCALLVELNDYSRIQEQLGLFETDNFVKFFTDAVSACLTETGHEASMTRISDSVLAVLLQAIPADSDINSIGERLSRHFDSLEYKKDDNQIPFSINCGLTYVNEQNTELNVLLNKLENACHQARKMDGNSFYCNTYQEAVKQEINDEVAGEIVAAFKDEKIQLLFQSMVNLSGSTSRKFTELHQVRSHLIGPDNAEISAKKFIPVLKQQDLLKRYDRWIIRECITTLANLEYPDDQKPGIFLPLTDFSFTDSKLTDWIDKVLAHAGSLELATSLIFEFNARHFLERARATKLQINKLRVRLGASVALSGFDDTATLEQCLGQDKFDFVMFAPEHIGDSGMSEGEMSDIAALSKKYKTLSIASKISSGNYLALSASSGIDYVLGHFVQPPMEKIIPSELVDDVTL